MKINYYRETRDKRGEKQKKRKKKQLTPAIWCSIDIPNRMALDDTNNRNSGKKGD